MQIYDGRESFWQWDLNVKVTSSDFTIGEEIHFTNMRQPIALTVKTYELEGKVVADVPNILLQTALPLRAYRYVRTPASSQTIDEKTFMVEQRPQPSDYFYTETELYALRTDVAETLAETKEAVSKLQEGLDDANHAVELATDLVERTEKLEDTVENAEQYRVSNEEQRDANESTRINAETNRVEAEALRVRSETKRDLAEEDRVFNERERIDAELDREVAEDTREIYENLRQDNENARFIAEATRVVNEEERASNETTRQSSETQRVSNENFRQQHELSRENAEAIRAQNEDDRTIAETKRVLAENDRREWFEANRSEFANTLKATASGEIVRVDDVSPIQHLVKVTIGGKNRIPYPYFETTKTSQGVTFTDNGNGTITVEGTPTNFSTFCLSRNLGLKDGVTYYLQSEKLILAYRDETSVVRYFSGGAFTWSNKWSFYMLYLQYSPGATINETVAPMLFEGDAPTEYEPYINPTDVSITSRGANILTYPYAETTKTEKGITLVDNGDGSLTVNGTATNEFLFHITSNPLNPVYAMRLPRGTYTFTGGIEGVRVLLNIFDDEGTRNYNDSPITLRVDENCRYSAYLQISAGTTVNNKTIYPQLAMGDRANRYEEYVGATHTPSADGTCEITSLSPTMTLFTDTPGVTIDLEYNQDTQKAMDNVRLDLQELDDVTSALIVDMGDVDAALDSIIAIQESLIGG